MKKSRLFLALFAVVSALIGLGVVFRNHFPFKETISQKMQGKATVSDHVIQYGPQVEARWRPFFQKAGVAYPPQKLVFVGLKEEKQLEIYATNEGQAPRYLRSFPILAASGKSGPKLREGDLQVPEGVYSIESLNPNSAFHLALRVSYPSDEDRVQAVLDRRDLDNLGGNIMIHGSNASIGCLAMGDEAAEDLFVLVAQSGRENIEVLLCPLDFRVRDVAPDVDRPEWVATRYIKLKSQLKRLPPP